MSARQQRAFRTIAAFAILVALILLLIPHSSHQHGFTFVCFLLLPVFLFGRVDIQISLWPVGQASKIRFPQIPILSPRFQRPPPPALALILSI
jgi:hypothetical protein